MAVLLKKTYRVTNLSVGFGEGLVAQLTEQVENLAADPRSNGAYPAPLAGGSGAFTINVAEDEAEKFLPGQLFEVSLTPVKSA